jgi:hypothetical protein
VIAQLYKNDAIPAYYEAAKKSNIESYSRTYSFAIAQNLGGSTFWKDLPIALRK